MSAYKNSLKPCCVLVFFPIFGFVKYPNFRCFKSHHITSKRDPISHQGVKLTWLWLKCDSKSKPLEVEICGLQTTVVFCWRIDCLFGGWFFEDLYIYFLFFLVIDRDLTSKFGMWMRFTRNWRVCDWQCPVSSMTLHGDVPVRSV